MFVVVAMRRFHEMEGGPVWRRYGTGLKCTLVLFLLVVLFLLENVRCCFKRFLNYEYEKKSLKKEKTLFLFKNLISCIVLSLSELPPCV